MREFISASQSAHRGPDLGKLIGDFDLCGLITNWHVKILIQYDLVTCYTEDQNTFEGLDCNMALVTSGASVSSRPEKVSESGRSVA